MSLEPETEQQFIDLLGYIYGAIDWRGIRTAKNPWDIWNHRVRAASTRPTIGEFASRLSNQFGLQSLPLEAIALTTALEPHAAACLDLAYREHIPVAMRAIIAAKARRAAKKATREE